MRVLESHPSSSNRARYMMNPRKYTPGRRNCCEEGWMFGVCRTGYILSSTHNALNQRAGPGQWYSSS